MEREAVGVVWALEKERLILIGCEFDLYTDNAAVQAIFDNPYSTPTARIRRLALRLLPFKFRVHHIKGSTNIADYQSRNPVQSSCCEHERIAEEYIYMVTTACIPDALTRAEVIAASAQDTVLIEAISALHTGVIPKQSPLYQMLLKNELSCTSDGLLLRGEKLIIPSALQQRMVDIGHTGHQGIGKTKAILRNHVWFPRMDEMVEKSVSQCHKCQANTDRTCRHPLATEPMPSGPWEMVDADFYGPLPNGKYKFVLIDRFSRFLVVRSLTSLRGESVIASLHQLVSEFGIMERLKTDNGPPFQGRLFKDYCLKTGIHHQRITPLWPRANGLVERVMQPLGKSTRVIGRPSPNYEEEVRNYVAAYNSTPHSTTGMTPRELMFRTKTSSIRMPTFHQSAPLNETQTKAVENDARAKAKSKEQADACSRAQEHKFRIGDQILLKQVRRNKTYSLFDPAPYTITSINQSMAIICRDGKSYARNVSMIQHFKQGVVIPGAFTAPKAPKPAHKASAISVFHFGPTPQHDPVSTPASAIVIPLPWNITPAIALPWITTPAIPLPWHPTLPTAPEAPRFQRPVPGTVALYAPTVPRTFALPQSAPLSNPQEDGNTIAEEEEETETSFQSMEDEDITTTGPATHTACPRCKRLFRAGAGIATHMRRNMLCRETIQ